MAQKSTETKYFYKEVQYPWGTASRRRMLTAVNSSAVTNKSFQ